MSDERTGRELTPRPTKSRSAVTPREARLPAPASTSASRPASRRTPSASPRSAPPRSSSRAATRRMVAFLAVLFVVLFIPIYWLYDIGVPVLGVEGRLADEARTSRSPTCRAATRCSWPTARAATATTARAASGRRSTTRPSSTTRSRPPGLPGTGHLNPDYIHERARRSAAATCAATRTASCPSGRSPTARSTTARSRRSSTGSRPAADISFTYQPPAAEEAAATQAPAPTWSTAGATRTTRRRRARRPCPPAGKRPIGRRRHRPTPSLAPVASPGTADIRA